MALIPRLGALRRKRFEPPMSQMGQSRHFGRQPTTSGLPLETDIVRVGRNVSKVPEGDVRPYAHISNHSVGFPQFHLASSRQTRRFSKLVGFKN